jgi:Ca-activated chloride channel family protein
MREAARFGRGTFTAIAQVNEVEEKMAVLIAKLENPSLTQIEVVAPGADIYPKRMPDLYLGEPMTFAAKLTGKEDSIMLHGRLRDEDWEMKLPLEGGGSQAGVYKNWAKRIVDYHLDSRSFGTPEDEVRQHVVALAMKFHMVTPYTSLVAVDQVKKPVNEPSLSRQIANAAPHGSNFMGNLPQGSTPAPLLLLLSLLSGLGSVFFGRRSWAS